jgi:hypothetical protein
VFSGGEFSTALIMTEIMILIYQEACFRFHQEIDLFCAGFLHGLFVKVRQALQNLKPEAQPNTIIGVFIKGSKFTNSRKNKQIIRNGIQPKQ